MSRNALPLSSRPTPSITFILLIFIYIFTYSLATLFNSGLIKFAANIIAIIAIFILTINWAYLPTNSAIKSGIGVALSLFAMGVVGSFLFNPESAYSTDLIKIALAPIFILFGERYAGYENYPPWNRQAARVIFILLTITPFGVWIIQWTLGSGWIASATGYELGIFANRNNAGFYAVAMLGLFSILRRQPIYNNYVFIAIGILFGTLGLLASILASLYIFTFSTLQKFAAIVATFVFLAILTNAPALSIQLRIQPVIDSIILLLSGTIDLTTITYGELVQRLHTTDLSFIFRLKHWTDLFDIFSHGSIAQWLFGFGVNSSFTQSAMHLVPHNDYLRILFEFGSISFCGFLMLMFSILRAIGGSRYVLPFFAVILYFASENLINNFSAMAIFYFSAGATMSQTSRKEENTFESEGQS